MFARSMIGYVPECLSNLPIHSADRRGLVWTILDLCVVLGISSEAILWESFDKARARKGSGSLIRVLVGTSAFASTETRRRCVSPVFEGDRLGGHVGERSGHADALRFAA